MRTLAIGLAALLVFLGAGAIQPTVLIDPGESITLVAEDPASVYQNGYHGTGGHGANWEPMNLRACRSVPTVTVTNIHDRPVLIKYYWNPERIQERGIDNWLSYEIGCLDG